MATSDAARLRTIERRRQKLRAELEAIEAERVELVRSMHIDQGMSHAAIARRLGVTKARVQQLVKQARPAD